MCIQVYVFFVIVTIIRATASEGVGGSGSIVFHKCCPRNQNLIKVVKVDVNDTEHYDCVDRQSTEKTNNFSYSPLLISDNISLIYNSPTLCDNSHEMEIIVGENYLSASLNKCYDRLIAEVMNGTLTRNIPQIVALKCIGNETENFTESNLRINHLRKCCPKGQSYDVMYHGCRNDELGNDEETLINRLNLTGNYIYEVEIGLQCKSDEYAVELKEKDFLFSIEGNILNAWSKIDKSKGGVLMQGEWCVDQELGDIGMVTKVCTRNCALFNAFCIRKCCPEGYHYKVRRCSSLVSICTPNIDEEPFFRPSYYLNPLESNYIGLTDIMGVRTNLDCPEGKFVLNISDPRDRHRLTSEGWLESSISLTNNYCIEMFDRRHCSQNDVLASAVLCFIGEVKTKDFRVSFVVNSISSVCLALTLVVYCSLPELRNLHGRNLICHVSMMLLGYSCLARVQYDQVNDNRLCKFLGYGIYFGFVAAFAWLNVMCFDIWWTFGSIRNVQPLRKSSSERRRFVWYSVYAWSIAVFLTLSMFLLDEYPVSYRLDANIGDGACWFGSIENVASKLPYYIFFVTPMGVVTITNFILWILTARHCARVKSEVHRLQAGSVGDRVKRHFRIDRAKYILAGKLWVVMGAGWISELLATFVSQPLWLWTIVDLFNELQGVFIFLILVVKPKLYYLIRKRLGCSGTPSDSRMGKPGSQNNGASSSARTSTTFLSRTISSDERTNLRTALPKANKQS